MGQEGRVFSPEALSKATSQHDVTGRGAEENHPLSGKIQRPGPRTTELGVIRKGAKATEKVSLMTAEEI